VNCLLIVNKEKEDALALSRDIQGWLERRGIESSALLVRADSALSAGELRARYAQAGFDFAVTLGGDGTVLFAARLCAPLGIPILPVNFGSFGFMCSIKKDKWEQAILAFLDGKTGVVERSMAEALIVRSGAEAACSPALNDIVITAKNAPRLVTLNVLCGGIALGSMRADALIISTATGSTAYSAAAGGPIIDPALDAFALTPICPFSLSSRPLVFSSENSVHIETREDGPEARVLADGQPLSPVGRGDTIIVRKSRYAARLLAGSPAQFYATLRSKMNWSGGPGCLKNSS
jgi:NAD+ kinase